MKIEGHRYDLDFRAVQPGDRIELSKDWVVEPFETVHRVKSQGYGLKKRIKHLKTEYVNLPQSKLGELRRQGAKIEEFRDEPWVCFTGDTQIEVFERSPWVKKSRILFLEVTYLDEKKSIEHTKKWGHLHLDELKLRIDDLECDRLAIMHVSRRYSARETLRMIQSQIPKKHWEKLFIVPPFNPEMLQHPLQK
jgi:ribonuclease Z